MSDQKKVKKPIPLFWRLVWNFLKVFLSGTLVLIVLYISLTWAQPLIPKNTFPKPENLIPLFTPLVVASLGYAWAWFFFVESKGKTKETVSVKLFVLKNEFSQDRLITLDSTKQFSDKEYASLAENKHFISRWNPVTEEYRGAWENPFLFNELGLSEEVSSKNLDLNSAFFESIELVCVTIQNSGRADSFVEPPSLLKLHQHDGKPTTTEWLPAKPVYISKETSNPIEDTTYSILTPGSRIKYFYSLYDITSKIKGTQDRKSRQEKVEGLISKLNQENDIGMAIDNALEAGKKNNLQETDSYELQFKYKGSEEEKRTYRKGTKIILSPGQSRIFLNSDLISKRDTILNRFRQNPPIPIEDFNYRVGADYVIQNVILQELFLIIARNTSDKPLLELIRTTLLIRRIIASYLENIENSELPEKLRNLNFSSNHNSVLRKICADSPSADMILMEIYDMLVNLSLQWQR